jgi:hypothetical protein
MMMMMMMMIIIVALQTYDIVILSQVCYVFRKPSFNALTVSVKSTNYEVPHHRIYLKANI